MGNYKNTQTVSAEQALRRYAAEIAQTLSAKGVTPPTLSRFETKTTMHKVGPFGIFGKRYSKVPGQRDIIKGWCLWTSTGLVQRRGQQLDTEEMFIYLVPNGDLMLVDLVTKERSDTYLDQLQVSLHRADMYDLSLPDMRWRSRGQGYQCTYRPMVSRWGLEVWRSLSHLANAYGAPSSSWRGRLDV